ncbi:YhcN/YlaJ family sporulation lipoprotein [Anaerobacillus sp. MEB173]|uniref:YhcN/YlaJ family sporulation lipoprotein n=1 Tax=Anaerobacillus sp. MEB173 TaxID=3383345 RepID=UPI003F931B65
MNQAQDNNNVNNTEENVRGQRVSEQASEPNYVNERDGNKVAKHLIDLATGIPDVDDATALVIGDFAVVGIDVNEKLDRSDVGAIKYQVAEAFKDDPMGANAIVVADPDVNVRLREMQKDIENGRPIAGIMDELAAIVGRMMPIVPGKEHDANDPTDVNDDKLSGQQQKELNKQQNKQAKEDINNKKNEKKPE